MSYFSTIIVTDNNGNQAGVSSSALDVSVANFPSSQAVTGTFWQTTQPVSAASWPLPSNAAQETGGNLATLAGAVSGANFQSHITNTTLAVTQSGNWNLVNISGTISLPTGAATAANQPSINGDGGALAHITNFPTTQAVSATTWPLPTGAATSALQTTGNTSLATLATNLPAQGQALAAASMPVVLTVAQITTLTPLSTVTANQGTANATPWNENIAQLLGTAIGPANAMPVYDGYLAATTASWTSSTTVNTALTSTVSGYDTVVVTFISGGTVTGGVLTFEAYDGANWQAVKGAQMSSYASNSTYTATSGSQAWQFGVAGFQQFRTRLSTVLTGTTPTALITHLVSSAPDTSIVTVGLDPTQALPAGTNILGSVTMLPYAAARIDSSSTIGTSAAIALASNASRKALELQNVSTTATLYFTTDGTTATAATAGTYTLLPGQGYAPLVVPTGAISVVASGAATPYTLKYS